MFSIIEHMKTNQPGDRCALISNDTIFHQPDTRELLEKHGAQLEMFKTIKALSDELSKYVWDAIKTAWDAERLQIETALNQQKDKLVEQILPLLPISKMSSSIWKSVREIKKFGISALRSVFTELPESSHQQPNVPQYERPDGSTVAISAHATAIVNAVVETHNFGMFAWLFGRGENIEETAITKDETFPQTLKLSITATVQNRTVGDFNVTGVEVENSGGLA